MKNFQILNLVTLRKFSYSYRQQNLEFQELTSDLEKVAYCCKSSFSTVNIIKPKKRNITANKANVVYVSLKTHTPDDVTQGLSYDIQNQKPHQKYVNTYFNNINLILNFK